jgi:predicted nucleotidyltransferase
LTQNKFFIQERYRIAKLGIFGSYIRGEQTQNSDVDILIDYTEVPGLLELLDLEEYLSDCLGIKADVVSQAGLKKNQRNRILLEVVYI